MKHTWKPTVAGILCIISGAVGFTAFFVLILALFILGRPLNFIPGIPALVPVLTTNLLLFLAIIAIATGTLSMVGGIYAAQRKKWGLVLAGSIAAVLASIPFFGPLPVGIIAIILVALSKDEFA